jgi:hypothetical protein
MKMIYAILLMLAATFASGQAVEAVKGPMLDTSLTFPGTAWSVLGNLSPIEHGNIQSWSYAEQGVRTLHTKLIDVVPFAAVTIAGDTKGYDWNRKALFSTGVKVSHPSAFTYSELSFSYDQEKRFISNLSGQGFSIRATFWGTWNLKRGGR